MLVYHLKCRKNLESKKPKVIKIKKGRIMVLSNYAVCSSKKSRFSKKKEAKGIPNLFRYLPLVLIIAFFKNFHVVHNDKQKKKVVSLINRFT